MIKFLKDISDMKKDINNMNNRLKFLETQVSEGFYESGSFFFKDLVPTIAGRLDALEDYFGIESSVETKEDEVVYRRLKKGKKNA